MSEIKFRQCHLKKTEGTATLHRVRWIPEQYAVLNKTVKLKEDDGTWTGGWEVALASSDAISERVALKFRDAYRYQRKASDI